MIPQDAKAEFEAFLTKCGARLAELDPARGAHLMVRFFAEVVSTASQPEADGLLFQWGTYDWGKGERFELDITRQFCVSDELDEDQVWHLSLTYLYPPVAALRELGSNNRWCFGRGSELAAFQGFVERSLPFQSAVLPSEVEVRLGLELQ